MAKVASDFEKIIHADRARRKNEALAAKIFNRRASTPTNANNGAAGPLASRAGVKKRVSSSAIPLRPAAGIHNEWTHDLHNAGGNGVSGKPAIPRGPRAAAGSLSSRVSRPGDPAPRGGLAAGRGPQRRAAQVARALIREEQAGTGRARAQPQSQAQPQVPQLQRVQGAGLSIRGIASASSEPLVVMAQNFAPGTTAADIESAMTPVGGIVSSCRILKTSPLVIAEIVFETRDGAERVIETFNNQTADGRLLHVYPKAGQSVGPALPGVARPPRALAATAGSGNTSRGGNLVDGSLGFDDPMDTDGLSGKLYSDDLVGTRPPTGPSGNRRGRGGWGGRGRR